MAVDDDGDQHWIEADRPRRRFLRRQILGLRIHDRDREASSSNERRDQPGPHGILDGSERRAKVLVNPLSIRGIDERQIDGVFRHDWMRSACDEMPTVDSTMYAGRA